MPLIPSLRRFARRRTDPRPLALVRIAVGMAALFKGVDLGLEQWTMLSHAPARAPYLFEVPEALWNAIPVLLGLWMFAAALLVVGWFSRTAAGTLAAVAGLLLALDQRIYGSHFYLMALICLLLTVSECGSSLSIGGGRQPTSRSIPAWPATLLKIQISLVYGFSGLAKINPSFLSGEVLDEVLLWSGRMALPSALREPAGLLLLSWLVIIVELFLGLGLWLRRFRSLAFVLGLGLHLFIIIWIPFYRLQLMVFSIESLVLYVLFLEAPPGSRVLVANPDSVWATTWARWVRRLDWLGVYRIKATSQNLAGAGKSQPALWLSVNGQEYGGLRAFAKSLTALPVSFLWAPVLTAFVARDSEKGKLSKVL